MKGQKGITVKLYVNFPLSFLTKEDKIYGVKGGRLEKRVKVKERKGGLQWREIVIHSTSMLLKIEVERVESRVFQIVDIYGDI